MPDDQNTIQNPIPEENSIPANSQEPIHDVPISPSTSAPVAIPLEAPKAPMEAESVVPVNNDTIQPTL